MFALTGVSRAYEGRETVNVPDWSAAQGEHRLLLGPSGCGKTTILHVLAGLLTPTRGTVIVADQDLAALRRGARDRFRGRTVGIVLQQLHLVSALTVEQNLVLAPYMAGLPVDRARIAAVLDRLGLADKAGARPSELSHGQAQRVALARAVINRPRVLIADEPTSALDDRNAARVMDMLVEEAAAENATLVVATHDHRVAGRFENRLDLAPLEAA